MERLAILALLWLFQIPEVLKLPIFKVVSRGGEDRTFEYVTNWEEEDVY